MRSTQGKVIAVVAVACLAVMLSVHVSRNVFREMMETVEEATSPNKSLNLINSIFRSVTHLQQRQRDMMLHGDTRTRKALDKASAHLIGSLDSLQTYITTDSGQMQRVEAMKTLLTRRGRLFNQYLALRKEVLDSKTLAEQMDSLSHLVSAAAPTDTLVHAGKTEVVEVEPSIETDTIMMELPSRTSFLKRIFARKKEEKMIPVLRQQIIRELRVRTDTLSLAQRHNVIHDMQYFIDSIKQVHTARNARFVSQELELMHAANKIMNELFDLLHEIELKELVSLRASNQQASGAVTSGLDSLKIIIGVFLFSISVLAVFILFDITRSNRYRRQLLQAKEEAEHLGNIKQRFLASMSHELRTPLQSIVGFAEQVRAQPKPDRGMLEAIYQSSDHLLHIVNEALDYSRIVAGKFVFERKPFRMGEVLTEVSEVMRLQAAAKSLALNFQCHVPADLMVMGDAFRLRQILYNIIGNAVKFTEQGGVSFVVERDISELRRFIFSVIDTGIGIPEEDVGRIFNVFEQGGEHFSHRGTGLGLSITKELVESQGGQITVESTPGIGSKFRVVLNFDASEVQITTTAPHDNLLRVGGKVVVIDDDPYIVRLISFILTKYGVDHTAYYSATEFLKQPWDPGVRLLLVDIRMPGMSGLDLCQYVRRSEHGTAVRIMAVTAQTLPEEHREIMQSGFDAILIKPFKEGDIVAAIQTMSFSQQAFNLSSIARMSRGDDELFHANLVMLVEETRRDVTVLRQCSAAGDEQLTAELLHRLAGRLGQVGSRELSLRTRALELQFRDGDTPEETMADLQVCIQDIEALTAEIDQYAQKTRDVMP
jgi:signal transduction histidine kinase/DNA-binding response OmpR family regulator